MNNCSFRSTKRTVKIFKWPFIIKNPFFKRVVLQKGTHNKLLKSYQEKA